jgi:DNA repair ATPase RecN
MNDEQILELIKATERTGTKLDQVTNSIVKIEERLSKLETLREQDIKQNEKIEQILNRLQQGNEHFDRIEKRIAALEQADGKRAKELVKQVSSIFIATLVGAIIANLGNIFHWITK